MNLYGNYKSRLGYQTGENQIDSYGVDHSGFSTRDELEYQFARQEREKQITENLNRQGIEPENYPQLGNSFWGNNPENNYGFGSSNIANNIKNMQNQTLINSGENQSIWNQNQFQTPMFQSYNLKGLTDKLQQSQNNALDKQPISDLNQLPDLNTLSHYSNPNQTTIPVSKQMCMMSTRPTLSQWLKKINTNPMTMNGTDMSGKERIKALVNGQPIVINVEAADASQESNANMHFHNWGKEEVDKYSDLIEQYAEQYNLDPNIVKSILYTEASDYHKYGLDFLADKINLSTSVRPMNIQGKTWGNFQGQLYDVKKPEQNIELGVRILKAIYDAVPDKDIAKIATLWNGTGLRKVNDYGKKAQEYYLNQSWKD